MSTEGTNFYRAFEDKFRGSHDLIKYRLQAYLPFIEPFKEIYPNATALDLGCGRGEWLELLTEQGFSAQGIDLDDGMLSACRKRNLNVQTSEAVTFLKMLPDESQVIISGFHLAEHIPFNDLQELVKESIRVLKPAGILILETPNPENIKVATESFYLDPTHVKPIPSKLLSFLPEFYGYERTKTLRLQENKNLVNLESADLLNVLEGVSPDYAVLAQKKSTTDILKQFDNVFAQEFGLRLTTLSARFENRLHKIETKANQAEAKANQAEAKASQAEIKAIELHTELHSVYSSRSWLITKPLRWFVNQIRLLSQQGFIVRFKALVKKAVYYFARRCVTFIQSRPSLSYRLVALTKKLGLYESLRTIYLRPQKPPVILQENLSSHAHHIYMDIKAAISERENKEI